MSDADAYVLIAERDDARRLAYTDALQRAALHVFAVATPEAALEEIAAQRCEILVAGIAGPDAADLAFLSAVREIAPWVPVILMTPAPELQMAIAALNLGVYRYLVHPVAAADLEAHVRQAIADRARLRERAQAAGGAARRHAERRRLRKALARLWMAYQPIVETDSQAIVGVEALLRSDHAELSMPLRVIAEARQHAATREMGRQVRRAVAADAAALPSHASIFVNLLAEDLADDHLYAPDAPLSRIAPRVVLELTEQASLEAIPDVEARIDALRALGFRIALDDLGAGYSSLSILARVHPEIVKLDRSLIHELHRSARRQAVVASVVDLCSALKIGVIGEGVESAEEAATLARLRVPHLQGNLIARPDRLAALVLDLNERRTNWNEAH